MIIEILLALFLVLVLRLLDGWVERRRDVLRDIEIQAARSGKRN